MTCRRKFRFIYIPHPFWQGRDFSYKTIFTFLEHLYLYCKRWNSLGRNRWKFEIHSSSAHCTSRSKSVRCTTTISLTQGSLCADSVGLEDGALRWCSALQSPKCTTTKWLASRFSLRILWYYLSNPCTMTPFLFSFPHPYTLVLCRFECL